MITPIISDLRPIVNCTIGGKTAPFLVDTGATMSIIDYDQLKKYGLKVGKKLPGSVVGAGGETSDVYYVKTPYDIKLEGMDVVQMTAMNLSDVVKSIERSTNIKIAGIIGTPVIKLLEMQIHLNDGYISIGY